jgi:hypothetical protein
VEFEVFFLLVVPIVIGVVILFRVLAGIMDRDRIRGYVETRGGKIIVATWAPFGPGWLGGNKERIYRVRYLDHDGNVHEAYARTSMWTGVYFTEDQVIHRAKPPADEDEVELLEEENRRLRKEVERLKRKQKDKNSDAIQE